MRQACESAAFNILISATVLKGACLCFTISLYAFTFIVCGMYITVANLFRPS